MTEHRREKSNRRFAALASGAGSTIEYLLNAQKEGRLEAKLVAVISDSASAGALEVARRFAVPGTSISPKDFRDREEWDKSLAETLRKLDLDFVLLAGFLKKIGPRVLADFGGRIVNTHPSLLPKFGGKGMYGRRVHQAVWEANESETGVTVHLVNENFDEGPALRQVRISIPQGADVEAIEELVKKTEKTVLLEFLNEWEINSVS